MVQKGEKELARCWERIHQAQQQHGNVKQRKKRKKMGKNTFRSQQVCAHVWQIKTKCLRRKESWREAAGNIVKC